MESTLLPITKNPKWSLAKESFNVKPLVTGTSSLWEVDEESAVEDEDVAGNVDVDENDAQNADVEDVEDDDEDDADGRNVEDGDAEEGVEGGGVEDGGAENQSTSLLYHLVGIKHACISRGLRGSWKITTFSHRCFFNFCT